MRVTKIEVKNFRLLKDVSIELDNDTTLIVGRNNSGKTSLTEVFYKFLGTNKAAFAFEDFSIDCYKTKDPDSPNFNTALASYQEYLELSKKENSDLEYFQKEKQFKSETPKIEINIFIEYEEHDNLASLRPFIMDLDIERKDALITYEYSISNPEYLYRDYLKEKKNYTCIVDFLKKKLKSYFEEKVYAVDAKNRINKRLIEKKSAIENVFLTKFIYAQRTLDDQATDNQKSLSKGFEDYYKFNSENNKDIDEVEKSLKDTSEILDTKYEDIFKGIFDDLGNFGINEGISIQKLIVKAYLDPEKILKGNTQLFYENDDETLLPESYNGLGFSNLIYIILRFISFYEEYSKRKPKPSFQLLFIEEPEAHLHPQMQQTFIRNINKFIESKDWNIQIIITTHSSHIISESGFENIRYFDNSLISLAVKNLSNYTKKQLTKDPFTINFLKQYMSINKCDMFFADKIIMVEGNVEKLLLPIIIKKVSNKLLSQYISIIEIGGAYAHRFKEILEFLNVKTLIITDIDSVDPTNKRKACKVNDEAVTSNQVLAKWLPKENHIKKLLSLNENKKTNKKIRIAYQIPEKGKSICGRSFEESFILANTTLLSSEKLEITNKHIFQYKEGTKVKHKTAAEIEANSYEIAAEINKKTDFAFDILRLQDWSVPCYIKEGLLWLEK